MIPVPPPRLRQAEHESGRVRLLGRLVGGLEFLADAARLELGFHLALEDCLKSLVSNDIEQSERRPFRLFGATLQL